MKLSIEELDKVRKDLASGRTVVRWHHLRAFGRSNAQGYAALTGRAPEKSSPAMESGSAVDSELLDGIDGNVIPVPEGMRRDERSKDWQAFKAANPGKIILTRAEYENVGGMVASVFEHHPTEGPSALELLSGSRKESIPWEREEGIWCQGTPDAVSAHGVCDLKRTSRANLPDRFDRHAVAMGWTGQMAYYREAVMSAGEDASGLWFVAVEAEPSLAGRRHEVVVFRMGTQVLEEAQRTLEDYWARLLRFLDSGDVSGYGAGRPVEMQASWKEKQ